MPSPSNILDGLTALSQQWRIVAIAWHVLAGALGVVLARGWRPPDRLLAGLLTLPLLSVSVLAWLSGNPFNGSVFALLAFSLLTQTRRLPGTRIHFGSPAEMAIGAAAVAFGWMYPHFLHADSWVTYTYAAPLGVVPCATLSAVVGFTWLVRPVVSRAWAATVVTGGLLYGLLGVFYLNVPIDMFLVASALLLAGSVSDRRARVLVRMATTRP
jgi:hypothetical protein